VPPYRWERERSRGTVVHLLRWESVVKSKEVCVVVGIQRKTEGSTPY
jgi:hypothetical protein